MIFLVGLVILVATVASFTRLATEDTVTMPWRIGLRVKRGDDDFWVRALECFRCTSVWVSPPFTVVALALTAWGYGLSWPWWIVLAALSPFISKGISYLAFILYSRGEA